MCGIVGLLVKRDHLRAELGWLATPMLDCMGTRGADSAGLAVFHEPLPEDRRRFALFSRDRNFDWQAFHQQFQQETNSNGSIEAIESHASVISTLSTSDFKAYLKGRWSRVEGREPEVQRGVRRPAALDSPLSTLDSVRLLSAGRAIDVYKDEGHPGEIARRYRFAELAGTHAVGHTRMATESAVSPAHAHPYTAGEDFCLVHNGSLSNPYSIRRKLEARGIEFETDNDTEAGCRFLEWRMREGDTLEEAIATSFGELDGFFTFLMATADKMVLVRDAFACKPAVVAETDDYVAVSSEFRSLAHLPDVKSANVFEPMPEQIYSWTV